MRRNAQQRASAAITSRSSPSVSAPGLEGQTRAVGDCSRERNARRASAAVSRVREA